MSLCGYVDGFESVLRLAAWKCGRKLPELFMAARDARRHLLCISLEAVRTGLPIHVVFMLLVCLGERTLAVEALTGVSFPKARVHAYPSIEHETLSIVVLAAALFEIFEGAAGGGGGGRGAGARRGGPRRRAPGA